MISFNIDQQFQTWPPLLLTNTTGNSSKIIINDNAIERFDTAIKNNSSNNFTMMPTKPYENFDSFMTLFERLQLEIMLQIEVQKLCKPKQTHLMKLIEFLKLVAKVQIEIDPTIDTSYDIFGLTYDPFAICDILKYFHLEAEWVHANEKSKFLKFFSIPKNDLKSGLQINNSDYFLVNNVNSNDALQIAGSNQHQIDNVVLSGSISHIAERLAIEVLLDSPLSYIFDSDREHSMKNHLEKSKNFYDSQMNNGFSNKIPDLDYFNIVWSPGSFDFSKNEIDNFWMNSSLVYLSEKLKHIWTNDTLSSLNVTNDSGFSSPRSRQSSSSSIDPSRSLTPKRLHVTNIPFVWRSPDIFRLFRPYGIIGDIQVIFSKDQLRRPLGYGYLTFSSGEKADIARLFLDQQFLVYYDEHCVPMIRKLTINLALPEKNQITPEQERRRFLRNFSKNLKEYLDIFENNDKKCVCLMCN